jgi:hypothetical protein
MIRRRKTKDNALKVAGAALQGDDQVLTAMAPNACADDRPDKILCVS